MPELRRPVRALFWITVGGKPTPILPLRSIAGLFCSLSVMAGTALAVDRWILPAAEKLGEIASAEWAVQNQIINRNNFKKNLAKVSQPIWRSAGFPVAEQKHTSRRILVMGDSFVWGDGYANMNDIWWRQLARELARRGYADIEVIAAGMCGWSTHDQLNAAPSLVEQYKPDFLLWGYVTNDPDEKRIKLITPNEAAQSEYAHAAHGALPHLAQHLADAQQSQKTLTSDDPATAFTYSEWEEKLLSEVNLPAYAETVTALAKFQRESGLPAFIMTLPNSPDVLRLPPKYAPVAPLFQSAGLEWHDILPAFAETYPLGSGKGGSVLHWGINPANGHPGIVSTHFYAVQAADYLEAHYPDALGPRTQVRTPSPPVINDWMPWNLAPSVDGTAYTFVFPAADDPYILSAPIGTPHVLLALAQPAAIRAIRLTGPALASARITLTSDNPALGYDDGTLHALARQEGGDLSWLIRDHDFAASVNTIRIEAEFSTPKRTLTVSLIPNE